VRNYNSLVLRKGHKTGLLAHALIMQ